MKRLFLALCLDELTRAYISSLGGQVPNARPVPSEQLHLTIRFIGDVEGTLYHEIKERLHELSSPSVVLHIKGVGHFPPRGNPRVLWAGVKTSSELLLLRNRVNTILRTCGIAPEARKFHPHITLARMKKSSPHRVAQFLTQHSQLEAPPAQISQLTLYSSILTQKGAIHCIEEQYPLGL